ncbi:MAG TPA: hypothetical protein VMJ93_09220 [Verrucomicrobiae bacterium]|nr:hypothetical protein [Verrucomicrobiae bacterium]
MRPDKVAISWDATKSSWLIRIEIGEEVVRRHADLPKSANDEALRAAAQKAVEDEGYQPDSSLVTVAR